MIVAALDFCLGVLSACLLTKLLESLDFNYKLKSISKSGKPKGLILKPPPAPVTTSRGPKLEENWDENIEIDEGVTAIKQAELKSNGPIASI